MSRQIENPLHISWHDSSFIPFLNPTNVMDYFSEKSNSFYDRSCNNEQIKMQRLSLEHLKNMVGTEYILLHVKEPLYVVRKQHRHSPEDTTPLADYYIIAGRVYQSPDLASVFNSRILNTVHHLQQAFDDANTFARYHPGKGYFWDFNTTNKLGTTEEKKETIKKEREEPSSAFQRQRCDLLLSDLLAKFPIPQVIPPENKLDEDKSINIKSEPQNEGAINGAENAHSQLQTHHLEKRQKMQ